jgi:hypothetical protein
MWFLERWLENPATVKKMVYVLYASLIISCLLGFIVQYGMAGPTEEEHAGFIWDKIPVFSAIYGFVGCALIIILSKAFGHAGIMEEEDYYDR